MNKILAVAFSLLLLPEGTSAQTVSATIRPDEWGLTDLSSIRLGRISLAHTKTGPRLTVQALYEAGFFLTSTPALPEGECRVIADFANSDINDLGGSFAVFRSGTSTASLVVTPTLSGTNTAHLTYSQTETGFCGLWMHLFNSAAPPGEHVYFKTSPAGRFHIRLRGSLGNERIILKIADNHWLEKQDALAVAEIGTFLPSGRIDTSWQTAVIPVGAFPDRIDRSRLGSLVLQPEGAGTGTLEISSIVYCPGPPADPPLSKTHGNAQPETERAMWVWNTSVLLKSPHEVEHLRSFVNAENIQHVFLAIPYDASHPQAARGVPIERGPMQTLLRALNASGLKVHALVGDKDFIKPEKRPFVEGTIENIIRYQLESDPAEQFYGLHLDIEPYLLPGFGSKRQSFLLEQFLDVLAEVAKRAADAHLVIGADIPSWLDVPDELTHVPMRIAWKGADKPVYQHVIDMMDFVVLMNYRTSAPEIVLQALGELRYARERGKKVFVGLETTTLDNETLVLFQGEPRTGLPDTGRAVCFLPRANGILVWVADGDQQSSVREMLHQSGASDKELRWWPVDREISVRAARLTFAWGDGGHMLMHTLTEAEEFFLNFASFAGFSIHDYEGYRALIGQ